jgi:hypothetical protein
MLRYVIYAVILAAVLLLGFVVHPERTDHLWEHIPIWEAAFGFLGCLLIIFVSKALGHLFIQKKEDYYDE